MLTFVAHEGLFSRKRRRRLRRRTCEVAVADQEAEKSQDRAYKKSLGNIPDKPAADPWGGARAVDGSSTTTTTPTKRTEASFSNVLN